MFGRRVLTLTAIFACFTIRAASADIPGACCFDDGTCEPFLNSAECESDGGAFAGVGLTCDNADCQGTTSSCDVPLEISGCPQTIVMETLRADGVEFDLPGLPTVEGCDPAISIDPPFGRILPVGENEITILATNAFGEFASCEFKIVVELVDESGPIQKRRIKGGGNTDATGASGCSKSNLLLPALFGGQLCGSCPLMGFLGSFAGMFAIGRRARLCRNRRC